MLNHKGFFIKCKTVRKDVFRLFYEEVLHIL